MSAGVCGKRVGFMEVFGPSKKPRCSSSSGSLTQAPEFGSGSDEMVLALMQKFPALDPELIKTVLRNHSNQIDDAIESLWKISFGDVSGRHESQDVESATIGNCDAIPGLNAHTCTGENESSIDGSKWVDLIVREITNAANIDEARRRACRILESFERNVTAYSRESKELEHASLKEHLQSLLNNNQILKRAIAIQHDHSLEQEEKMRELQNVKHVLSQYQERIQTLKLNNYALELHLQRARQEGNSFLQSPPDIY